MLLLLRHSIRSNSLLSLLHPHSRPFKFSVHTSPIIAMAVKRKSAAQTTEGAKRAKAATEYAAATEPGIPQTTPLAKLLETMHLHHEKIHEPRRGNVVHWFRSDLRLEDNRALHAASQRAQEQGKYLIALYVVSPQDWRYHKTAAIRVDFILRTLRILQMDLAELNIPLHVEVVEPRKGIRARIVELMNTWDASELFANIEYEIDELERDERFIRAAEEPQIKVTYCHDQCVVEPGTIVSGQGKPMSVYSPWLRKWIPLVQGNDSYLFASPKPSGNPSSIKQDFSNLFSEVIPSAPKSHAMAESDEKRFASLWPAGEHAAQERLEKFCRERISDYALHRSEPGLEASSCMSVHLSQGTISARACIRLARTSNTSRSLDKGKDGIVSWISEVAWRDFYRHVLAAWPHVCKNQSYKPQYDRIEWEDSPESFLAWCEGRTGVPIVDAAMRQLNTVGWMHNRCRMIVASFLSKHLLVYWRLGERYFMQHLIDGDFASNNGGWQWSVGSGNDASPWFRIFNPWTQSAKFDPRGDYIRRYVKELEGVEDAKIHVPHEKLSKEEFEKLGYPRPIVEHKFARERCLERFKAAVTKNEE